MYSVVPAEFDALLYFDPALTCLALNCRPLRRASRRGCSTQDLKCEFTHKLKLSRDEAELWVRA